MACYRSYAMDSDNRLVSDTSAECRDDPEACVLAKSLLKPSTRAEVWKGTKLVRVLSLAMAAE
jgi:hypothetical protein